MKCKGCGRLFEKNDKSTFELDGLVFFMPFLEEKCPWCLKEIFVDRYVAYCKELVKICAGRIEVDWTIYKKFLGHGKTSTIRQIVSVLLSLNILVEKTQGWKIEVPGVFNFMPCLAEDICVYFAEERFAMEYAKVMLAETVTTWKIVRI